MSHLAPDDFRPFVVGEERIGSYIRAGGYLFAPYWNGAWTAATNFNHLLAFSRKPIIEQHGSADITYVATSVVFAKYVIKFPPLHDRRYLRLEVTGTTTGGTTFTITGEMSGGGTFDGTSTATASGGTASFVVEVDKRLEYDVIELAVYLSASGTFTVTDVRAYSEPDPTSMGGATLATLVDATAYGAGNNYQPNALYTPQDTDQYAEDQPLSVGMMHDLQVGLQAMFRDNVSPLVNWSYWGDHSSLPSSAVGLQVPYNANITSPATCAQYIYYPRQGVKNLHLFLAARTNNYVADPGVVTANWRPVPSGSGREVDTDVTEFTMGDWLFWRVAYDVPPNVPGPLYFEIRGLGSSEGPLYIQSVAIYESVTS